MNHYGHMAMAHWRQHRPSELATIEDPTAYFTDLGGQVMVAALRLVAAGGIYAPPTLGPRGPGSRTRAGSSFPGRPTLRLSQREAEVLRLIERCRSNREIAQELGLAEATVKIHVSNLLRKTGSRNRAELALLAAQAGPDA